MLTFDPPYEVIGGYTLLGDSADPRLWYALAPVPALALDAAGRPALSIVEYLGTDRPAGAVVTLTTELAIPDDVLAGLAGKLRDRLGPARVPAGARVVPAQYDSGTVELIVLGRSTGAADPPPAGTGTGTATGTGTTTGTTIGTRAGTTTGTAAGTGSGSGAGAGPFAISFAGPGRADLGARNRAGFQLVTDADAATLLTACLDSPDLPVLVVYRLQLTGLRPSLSIRIEADWSKLYATLHERAGLNAWYVSADVETMVTKALEDNAITIDETVYGTGPEARDEAEKARKILLDWVVGRLFTPLVDPAGATATTIGQVVGDTVDSLTRTLRPGLVHRLREVSDEELRTMSARLDETVAERRELVPQGTLGGLLQQLRVDEDGAQRPGWPALKAALLTQVELAGFPRLEVTVGVEDRFATDGVAEVAVELARGEQDRQTLSFRDAATTRPYVVNLLGRAAPSLSQPYRWRADVRFDPAGPLGPAAPVALDWRDAATTQLFVEPREAYQVPEVTVAAAPTFSWDQFPAVDVDLRHGDRHGRLTLTRDHPAGSWRFRADAGPPAAYGYAVTYHRSGDGPIAVPERETVDTLLTVPDPLPRKRRLNVLTSLPWDRISTAFLELKYDDDSNGIHTDEQLDLSAGTPFLRRDLPVAADGPVTVAYRLTVLFTDGRLLEGSWRSTDDDRLVIDQRTVDTRVVTVRVVGGPPADRGLREVRLALQVPDPVTGATRAATELVLDGDTSWEYLAGDPPARGVRHRAVFTDDHGFPTTTAWATSTSDLLVVSLRARTVSG